MRSLLIAIILPVIMVSCSGLKTLQTSPAVMDDIKGNFDVIFYYDPDPDNIKKVAILDIAGDDHTISVYDTHYNIREKNNVPSEEAFNSAVEHVKGHLEYDTYKIKRIHAPDGSTIGFEVRPIYVAIRYGMSDVLDIHYIPGDGGAVTAFIKLDFPLQMRKDSERYDIDENR